MNMVSNKSNPERGQEGENIYFLNNLRLGGYSGFLQILIFCLLILFCLQNYEKCTLYFFLGGETTLLQILLFSFSSFNTNRVCLQSNINLTPPFNSTCKKCLVAAFWRIESRLARLYIVEYSQLSKMDPQIRSSFKVSWLHLFSHRLGLLPMSLSSVCMFV